MKPSGRPQGISFAVPSNDPMSSGLHDEGEGEELPVCPRRFGFIFDCVVVRMDAPTISTSNTTDLSIEVDFNNMPLAITSSRINVVEFQRGRGLEFESSIADLRSDMQMNPLNLRVLLMDETIGFGSIVWPETVINRIKEHMGELTHVDQCELLDMNHESLGSVEVLVRIFCKCDIDWSDKRLDLDALQGALRRDIDPHDVLFLVGDNKEDCDSIGPAPYRPRKTASFDLSPYHCMQGKTVPNTDVINTCHDKECTKKRKKPQYMNIVDQIVCANREKNKKKKKAPPKPCPCPSESSSEEEEFPRKCFAKHHEKEDEFFGGEKLQTIPVCAQVSCPELKEEYFTRPRKCPICKQDIAWLPKNAACPKCGYKPILHAEEKPYDENLTADDIVRQYLEPSSTPLPSPEPSQAALSPEGGEKIPSRCTCTAEKTCNYCRVREICKDICCGKFQKRGRQKKKDQPEKQRKRSSSRPCERRSSELYAVCKSSSQDCRPYLARVFSELKDLYDAKACKREPLENNPECEEAIGGLEFVRDRLEQGGSNVKDLQEKQRKLIKRQIEKNRQDEEKFIEEKRKQQEHKRMEAGSCPCGDFSALNRGRRKKKSKGKRKSLYAYALHNKCKDLTRHSACVNLPRKNVPRNMGWLWNLESNGTRRGWKPGAIRKPIKEIMKYFLRDFPADTLRVSQYSYRNRSNCDENQEEELVQHPTLHICKKKDEYIITLRPLKDAESLKFSPDPYLPMKPVQFRIIKNPQMIQLRNLKCAMKKMGFQKCTCHKPVSECFCRNYIEKKRLDYCLEQECRKRCIPDCAEKLVLTDTSESDEEFDFGVTPPAGVIKPHLRKKPDLVNQGTQYNQSDWNVPPLFPRPPNRYAGYIDCATLSAQEYGGFGGATGGPYGPGGICSQGPPKGKGHGRDGAGGRGGKGGKGGKGGAAGGAGGADGADGAGADGKGGKGKRGPINMMQYLKQNRASAGGGRQAALEKRRKLSEMPPPILCNIERRGKPIDPCRACCYPCDPCYPRIC